MDFTKLANMSSAFWRSLERVCFGDVLEAGSRAGYFLLHSFNSRAVGAMGRPLCEVRSSGSRMRMPHMEEHKQ